MAKKKSGGSSIGLILTLIFFVLATFITGTVAYFGYEEVEGHKAKAAEAKKAQTTAETQYRDERVRKVMLRIAMGVEDPADRVLLVQELEPLRPQVKEEFERMKRGLEGKVPDFIDPKDPQKKTKSGFYWPLISMSAKDIEDVAKDKDAATLASDPATAPMFSISAMFGMYKDKTEAAKAKQLLAETALAAEKEKFTKTDDTQKAIDQKLKDLEAKFNAEIAANHAKIKTEYDKFERDHKQINKKALEDLAKKGTEDNAKADQILVLGDKIKAITELLDKLQNQNSMSSRNNAVGTDSLNLEERKGEIVRKEEGGYVTINIGSSKKLRPQVTFLVVSADVSWLALQEKEKTLDRNATRLDRQTYEDNPYVKAGIEVVEILGPDRARAKIIFENEPIRNPVQVRDQIFNLAWQPEEEIRIAFSGIIDLDGDGLDNNEDFLRLLERQGVVVDEYLKLKPLEFVKRDGRGMSLQTKYLVIAPNPRAEAPIGALTNTPQAQKMAEITAKMSDINNRARELGVQMIEARKFLAMIGYKLPRNPVPPQYGSSAYLDIGAPQPMPDMKKDGN